MADFAPAFRIATGAGLVTTPHAGFYLDAAHVRARVEVLGARRIGRGLRATEDPATLDLLAGRGVTRLNAQYGIVRALGLTDAELAHLARTSIGASAAPAALVAALLSEVDACLAEPSGDPPGAVA